MNEEAFSKIRTILQTYWGYEDFRGIQREIIESIMSGNDTLGLMPTGGGKSITFQVPALAQHGVCVVVTPLIALMKDQVEQLRQHGVQAAAINSSMNHEEILTTLENAVFGGVKILYVSPERLGSELFQKKLSHMHVSFITVDEAHCISQWGYDFRPSYLEISKLRKLKPKAPVLALTATATPEVIEDIQRQLTLKETTSTEDARKPFNVFRMSYERKNLAYIVRHTLDKEQQLIHILKQTSGCAIVYVRSRRKTKEIAELLERNGISALSYNAGLDGMVRNERQEQWKNDEKRVMVATNAFGMGIDKSDVRLVIHMDCPDSLEAYFQEAGRAGRDGRKSYAVLLYNGHDQAKLMKRISDNFPDKDYIRTVYEHLAYFYQIAMGTGYNTTHEFDIDLFCRTFKHFPIQVDSALKILSRSGYLDYDENNDNNARIHFLLSRNQLYRLDNLSENQDKVITTLLRNYGGLFSDYEYINELLIARQTGLSQQQVYMILKNLSQQRILHFIPHRKIPSITYLERREEMERLVIPTSVYEDRKTDFEKRVKSVIQYATNDRVCRSRQLLRYFGETRSKDCKQCDVCLAYSGKTIDKNELAEARESILGLLSDHVPHHITEINEIMLSTDVLDAALDELIIEEEIALTDGFLTSNTNNN
ncbi:MAG: RecQ family ATP-dependent DNA helicase [Prevotella sp.]|nr:RecQ family ATP-dependent DNA helicase [Prevotella sp.]